MVYEIRVAHKVRLDLVQSYMTALYFQLYLVTFQYYIQNTVLFPIMVLWSLRPHHLFPFGLMNGIQILRNCQCRHIAQNRERLNNMICFNTLISVMKMHLGPFNELGCWSGDGGWFLQQDAEKRVST